MQIESEREREREHSFSPKQSSSFSLVQMQIHYYGKASIPSNPSSFSFRRRTPLLTHHHSLRVHSSPPFPHSLPFHTSYTLSLALSPFQCHWRSQRLLTLSTCLNRRGGEEALEVIGDPGGLNGLLLRELLQLHGAYVRHPIVGDRHQETIFAAFFRSLPGVQFRRECLRMGDGGTVALDWPVAGVDPQLWREKLPPGSPALILLPGLTGGSDDTYVQHMLLRARRCGWNVVVFNSRGCADSPVTTPKFYSASFTEDLRQVVKYVNAQLPESRLYAASWSLGGNILVRYLGQEGQNCPLAGAVSLCNPFDLVIADEDFHKGFNNVYDWSLARALRKIFRKHAALFEGLGGEYNIPKAATAKTVRDFDDGLTRVSFGYKSVDDYYYDASSSRSIPDVRIPLLCIQANDDPIAPSRGIPRSEIKKNSNCLLVVTPSGGHLGWVAGDEAPFGAPWTDPLVMKYLEVLERIAKEGNELKKHEEDMVEAKLVSSELRETSSGAHGLETIT